MLGRTYPIVQLLQDMRVLAQLDASVSDRISITRDMALCSLAIYSVRRGFDLSFTLGSQVLWLLTSAGMIFNFHFGKAPRGYVEAVVVLAEAECLKTCEFRGVTEYISATLDIGWDLTERYLFPVFEPNGARGKVTLAAPRIMTTLQVHLRAARLPDHYTMRSLRVGVHLTSHWRGWKTEQVAW